MLITQQHHPRIYTTMTTWRLAFSLKYKICVGLIILYAFTSTVFVTLCTEFYVHVFHIQDYYRALEGCLYYYRRTSRTLEGEYFIIFSEVDFIKRQQFFSPIFLLTIHIEVILNFFPESALLRRSLRNTHLKAIYLLFSIWLLCRRHDVYWIVNRSVGPKTRRVWHGQRTVFFIK